MKDLINDLSNFQLVVFGIAVTLFTVIYSFILTKRDELKVNSEEIKYGRTSPLLQQKNDFIKKNILNYKKINIHILRLMISSLVIYLIALFSKQLTCQTKYVDFLSYIIFSSSLVIFIYIVVVLSIVVKGYYKNTLT